MRLRAKPTMFMPRQMFYNARHDKVLYFTRTYYLQIIMNGPNSTRQVVFMR